MNDNFNKIKGLTVIVRDDHIEKALRKFKKKVLESGKMQEVKDRQTYEKPTTVRKKKKAAAKSRWKRKIAGDKLPPKLY